MKRRFRLSTMLTLAMLLSLISLPSATYGQQPRMFRANTGVITPAAGQVVRITVAGTGGNDTIRVRFRWMKYASQGCSGIPAVCSHTVQSQGITPLETLGPDDAASFELQGAGDGVRVIVESDSRDARVVLQIADAATGQLSICTFIPD